MARRLRGPGVPDPPPGCRQKTSSRHRHRESHAVRASADCITNTPSRPPVRDWVFADHNVPGTDRMHTMAERLCADRGGGRAVDH